MRHKNIIQKLGFIPKENTSDVFIKKYVNDYAIEVDFEKKFINYGDKIKAESKTTQNFFQAENWVVLECVNRLLEKGYNPDNIILEKIWASGHGTSGRLDICVTRDDGSEYLLIECKTWGKEFEKEFSRMNRDGGQLFTYFKFSNKADVIMLYASDLNKKEIVYRNEIIKIDDAYRIGDVKDFYSKWNKLTKDNGVFEDWVAPYEFISKALTPDLLNDIKQEDSSFIFNQFLEILRHNVVSDKPNAFNKIFTLFLCKIYDEKTTRKNEELKFQWLEGTDDDVSFQMRLADLYKNGMDEFLDKKVTDFSEDDFEKKYASLFASDENLKNQLKGDIAKLRLEKNNEFAIKEVFDPKSFKENAKVVKQVVELLQGFKIRYTKKQQYLSDFFEMLLTTGLKQESGQFFTPVPIAQFIIKSMPIDELVDRKLQKGERNSLLPYIIDYAAGSGHFLTEVMHEIQRILDKKDDSNYISATAKKIRTWQDDHFDWAFQYVYGVEKDYRLVKVGKVGCYLHGDGLANVIHSDGLGNFTETEEYKDKLAITDSDFPKENKQFDIVVSNPPYSVQAFKQNARDYYTEKNFDLYSKLTDNSSEIECLFVERTKQLLKDDGMAGIILPSSILSNTGIYTKAREIILQNFDIVAIVELGSNTFMATGTNTVTLFLRRRNNYDSINLRKSVAKFFVDSRDVTLNGIEKPVSKYIAHAWDGISFADYKTLLQKQPNNAVQQHEIYHEYLKKIKVKDEQKKWNKILKIEEEKLFYFLIAYPQKVVLVKSGQKKAEKQFIGYYFSNRRGSEGIHPMQRGKSIEECTQLFDADVFDNPKKASTYIYKAFKGDFNFPIHKSLQKNISRANLVDMFTFDRIDFEKNISLFQKKRMKIESKWEVFKLFQLMNIVRGASPRPIKEFITNDKDGVNWIKIGDVSTESKFISKTKEKITLEGSKRSRKVNKGDFILSNSMSFGRPYIMDTTGCIHDGWLLLTDFDKRLNKDYLYNILYSVLVQEQFTVLASGGTTVNNLNIAKVSSVQIPLPSKEVQEKIVAEIEFLEQKKKIASNKIVDLEKEINNIYLLSKTGFDEVVLSKEIQIVGGGTPDTNKPEYWNGDIPWLSIVDFKGEKRFVETTEKTITEDGLKNSSAKYLEKSDLIISARGTVGALAQLKKPMTFNQSCYGIKANKRLISNYLYFALKFEIEQFKVNSYGMIFDTITTKTFDLIKIPLPSIEEQKEIVSTILELEKEITTIEADLTNIDNEREQILRKHLESI